MKKIQALLILVITFSLSANAQSDEENAFSPGHSTATVGYGFPNIYKAILKSQLENRNAAGFYSGSDNYKYEVKGYGPLFFKYEYGLTKLIGLGAAIGYWNTKYIETRDYTESNYDPNTGNYISNNYKDVTNFTFSSLSVGARLNFHFGTGEKLDPYAGVAGGYTKTSYTVSTESTNPNHVTGPVYTWSGIPIYFAFTAGLRYYFTPNIGIYGEIGLDKWSIVQGGMAFHF
ncbi:MAG: hypothetical protein K0Q95_485 [Bacteroidota bacterium]|jgi:hypothetical protein|nr:hypothetical protein [Bacteroidota bacterium]